MNRVKGIPL